MTDKVLTVCVVTYNQEKYIRQCLDSLINQKTALPYCIIISDDASTDDTSKICEEYARNFPYIKYIRHVENIGAYENFKYAHQQANSKYVSHCDGDDYWDLDKIDAQVDFLESNSDCSAVYSNALVVNSDGSRFGLFNNAARIPKKINSDYLLEESNFLNNSSMTYRKNAVGDLFYSEGKIVDYRVHIRLSEKGLLGYIKTPLASYRKGAEGSLCLNSHSEVSFLVQKARAEGVKKLDISAKAESKIKANIWYVKLIAKLKHNTHLNGYYKEVDQALTKYNYLSAFLYLFKKLAIVFLKKTTFYFGRKKSNFKIMMNR